MWVDLTGGLGEDREFVFATQPEDPEMRESVNVWVWDDGGRVGLPRVGVEAVADQWDTHDVQVDIAFAGGRVVNVFAAGEVHDPRGADGRPRVLGAGPLSFELVEPFRHWRARIDGAGAVTSAQAQIDGWMPGRSGGDTVPRGMARRPTACSSARPPSTSSTRSTRSIPEHGPVPLPPAGAGSGWTLGSRFSACRCHQRSIPAANSSVTGSPSQAS
jgi:hypothetical protein